MWLFSVAATREQFSLKGGNGSAFVKKKKKSTNAFDEVGLNEI